MSAPGVADDPADLAPIDPDRRADWDALAADYAAGFARGRADRIAGREQTMTAEAPDSDPWWTAHCRGYLDGFIAALDASDAAGGAAGAEEETGDGDAAV